MTSVAGRMMEASFNKNIKITYDLPYATSSYLEYKATQNITSKESYIIDRPGVAGAVLQTASPLIT